MNSPSSPFMPSGRKYLTGLLGRDILASRSPWLHEREADAQGVRLVYKLFDFAVLGLDVADLPTTLNAAERMGFAGLNVTHPFKQAMIPHLDTLSAGAARIGAVNTVVFVEGKRIGHNTDVSGFAESFEAGLPDAARERVVQVGAGGAGSATAHALLELGVSSLAIFDQDAARRAALVDKLRVDFGADRIPEPSDLATAIAVADGVVNATPLGMAGYPGSAVPAALLSTKQWVADIVYFPLETELLREARGVGCRTLDGSGMVVFQAAAAFDLFTGLSANRDRMLKSFVNFVSESAIRAA